MPPGGAALKRVGFSLGAPGEVVSLTGVNVHLSAAGERRTVKFPGASLEKHGYRLLYRDLHLVESESPLIVLPLEGVAGAKESVDLDLFFGVAA
jgi:hypothetical protein